MKKIPILTLVLVLIAAPCFAIDQKLVDRLDLCTAAFHDLMNSSDSGVPRDFLRKSEAIVIFPRTLNLAWGIGGEFGKGVLLKHDKSTGRWSKPVFYALGGVTLGPQIGGQAVDIVLVVMNPKGLESLLKSQSTLGGDAGIALGPVGRNATASTDLRAGAEIYSYSRAKGLYLGLSLKGAIVKPDKDANAQYYGPGLTARDILLDNKGQDQIAHEKLLKEIYQYTPPVKTGWLVWVWGFVLLAGLVIIATRYLRRSK